MAYIKSINSTPIVVGSGTYYGTCSTSYSTSAKVVTSESFQTLSTGVAVTVRFSNYNSVGSSALTLNVNSTGAKTISVGGVATSSTNQLLWGAGAVITFVYDGTYWEAVTAPRVMYGTCSTSSGSTPKSVTVNSPSVVICSGSVINVGMTYANTNGSAALSMASTGSKNVYHGTSSEAPTTDNGHSWDAGSVATLVFDGAVWRV